MLRKSFVFAGVFAAAMLGGCDSGPTEHTRDFNELIPRMLGAINKSTPEEAAANLFKVTSPDEQRDAIAYLETKPYGHQPPYMKAYELLATAPNPMVRAQAMRALGTSYQADAGVYLAKGLDDSDNVEVRRDAAYGLISTWNDAAFAPLVKHVTDDPDALVRGYCARALSHARTTDAIHALITALTDEDAAVTHFAHSSLVSVTGQDMSYDTKAWLNWYRAAYTAPTSAPVVPGTTRPG